MQLILPIRIFCDTKTSARYLLELGHKKYLEQNFADLAYFEPFYLKEFQSIKNIIEWKI